MDLVEPSPGPARTTQVLERPHGVEIAIAQRLAPQREHFLAVPARFLETTLPVLDFGSEELRQERVLMSCAMNASLRLQRLTFEPLGFVESSLLQTNSGQPAQRLEGFHVIGSEHTASSLEALLEKARCFIKIPSSLLRPGDVVDRPERVAVIRAQT